MPQNLKRLEVNEWMGDGWELLDEKTSQQMQGDPNGNFKTSIFVVKYRQLDYGNQKHNVYMEYLPTDININAFKIDVNEMTQKVNNVQKHGEGDVKFLAIEVDNEAGYITGSKVSLWTHSPSRDQLNIVHMHVNDSSESVAIDIKYAQDHEYKIENGESVMMAMLKFDFSKETFG
jgi:hypothetical protein